ncbi:hypothetical protein BDN67DRAFT_974021 [Paxillus ammoniavirescens]|nr:hypothetical protein BDN67DRAFT_974021 [Paxillus ammoniavirescens]
MESATFGACLVTLLAMPLATFNMTVFLSNVLIAGTRFREMSAAVIISIALSEVDR